MNKVVYNDCFGGFGLSKEAVDWLKKNYPDLDINKPLARHDPRLVECIEVLQGKASGRFARLRIATINGNTYIIHDYDGDEVVLEPEDLNWITIEN